MESEGIFVCPNCGYPATPGEFCSECGYEIPPAREAVAAASATTVAAIVTNVATESVAPAAPVDPIALATDWKEDVSSLTSPISKIVSLAENDSAGKFEGHLQKREAFSSGTLQWDKSGEGDQSPIEVAVKMPDAFLEGCMSAITFKLRSRGECFSDVVIIVRRDTYEVGRAVVPHAVTDGDVTDLIVNVTPECHGNIAIQFDLECRREDARDIEQYVSNAISVLVWPSRQDSGRSVTINSTNTYRDIKVSGAGDADFSKGSNEDLVSALGQLTKDDYSEKIAQYAKDKPFRHLHFRIAKLPNRLTIVSNDGTREIILFSANEISFGRGRENDAILSVLDATGAIDEDRTGMISRKHFRFIYENHRCYVADGTLDKETKETIPSSLGTEYDGECISESRRVMIAPGEAHTIILSPDEMYGYAMKMSVKAFGCPQTHKAFCKSHCPNGTSAVLMSREDRTRLFLIVWKCIDMGEFLPGYEGYYIHRKGDRFVLCRPDGVLRTLLPGNEYGKPKDPFFVTVNGMGH